ncbi:hypothetical protein llap_17519 [Limosa lapponica baueri]|uniref:Uncharacterized protein n=1 Tax=Limosa lapponica baueri TaxID=1758121 RepID=A0A2I0TEF6_LIMLA|nr:hypothetical protein llap_17519 [Limosa lapponica baueri]
MAMTMPLDLAVQKHLCKADKPMKPKQGSLDDAGVSTDYSRVMGDVASKHKGEACLRQKSHPPKRVYFNSF